jgi:hypothetical protein
MEREQLMMEADPELFDGGACGRPLPAGELLQSFRFGQFCLLNSLRECTEIPVVRR